MTFVRAVTTSGYSVEKSSPLGRLTTSTVEDDASNAELRQVDLRNGLTSTSRRTLAELVMSVAPDGSQLTATLGPDPRFDILKSTSCAATSLAAMAMLLPRGSMRGWLDPTPRTRRRRRALQTMVAISSPGSRSASGPGSLRGASGAARKTA